MANKQISQLNLKASVAGTDQFGVDDLNSVTWKVTAAQILTYIQANSGFSGGILGMANGGSNAALTAANGAIPYSSATALALLAPGTSGQLFQSGGAGAPNWTTATYPSTISSGNILFGSSANTVGQYAATANSVLGFSGVSSMISIALGDGQFAIGSSIGQPTAGTVTAGTGISVALGHSSLTVSSNGAQPWVDETGAAVTMAANTGYTSDDGATLVTFTLPTASAIGDWVEINGKGSGLWTIAQAAGQQIKINGSATTSGATGTLSSVGQYDNVRLRCLTANTIWTVVSQQSAGLTVV